jgi:plastocyanin
MKPLFAFVAIVLGMSARAGEVHGRVPWPATPQSPVVVWVEGPHVDAATIKQPIVIRQQNMQFVPSFVVVSRGQAIQFPNVDTVMHSVYSTSPVKSFDLGPFAEQSLRSVIADHAGVIDIHCSFHHQMNARILVVDSAFYALAQPDGSYTIHGVPPGKHRLKIWRAEGAGIDQEITVEGGN